MSNLLKEHSSAVQLCHSSPPLDKGKGSMRSQEMDIESGGAEIDWTKHVSSSSGRTYLYNKHFDMSQ